MKDEREQMQEYLKQYTNANSEILKPKSVHRAVKAVKLTTIIILMLTAIAGIALFSIFAYPKIAIFFNMNTKQFVKLLEKEYNQKIQIVQEKNIGADDVYILKTKMEPQLEFYATKSYTDSWNTDYEDRALIYYINNENPTFFKSLKYDTKTVKIIDNYERITCDNMIIEIETYSQIEDAVGQIQEIKNYMKNKLKTFNKVINLKIGNYTSCVGYENIQSKELMTLKEKYEYYWFLKDNEKDISSIPKEDIGQIKYPRNMQVYVNGEKLKNLRIEEQNQYVEINYNIEKNWYEISTSDFIISCDKFEFLSGYKNSEFTFKYNGKEYGIHYKNNNIIGNKLPYLMKLDDFANYLNMKISYNLEEKRVDVYL